MAQPPFNQTEQPWPTLPEDALNQLASEAYCVVDDWLPSTTVAALRTCLRAKQQLGDLHAAGTSQHAVVQPRLRSDHIVWLEDDDADPVIQRYFACMAALQTQLNRNLMIGLDSFETHFACYAAGSAGYATHIDQFQQHRQGLAAGARALTMILYLNEDWPATAGGALRLYTDRYDQPPPPDAPALDIAPLGGRLVLFLSARFWHQVLPSHRDRLSVTGWFKRR